MERFSILERKEREVETPLGIDRAKKCVKNAANPNHQFRGWHRCFTEPSPAVAGSAEAQKACDDSFRCRLNLAVTNESSNVEEDFRRSTDAIAERQIG